MAYVVMGGAVALKKALKLTSDRRSHSAVLCDQRFKELVGANSHVD